MSQISNVLGYWLRRAGMANAELFTRQFSGLDLSMLQYGILVVVDEQPGIPQKTLSRILSAKPSVLVKPLERLQQRGLIKRSRAAPDRRVQAVELTEAGRKMVAQLHALTSKTQALLLRNIDPDQQKVLVENLSQIVQNVEQMDR